MEIIVIYFLIGLFIVYKIYDFVFGISSSNNKGKSGEQKIARRLNRLSDRKYKVLNDVMIESSRGSSQIDHIVVSIYGIFVIETKNYAGWIHGHQNSEYWTQSIYDKKTKFRNPVKQNWGHIYALKEILHEYGMAEYYPIVVFSGKAKLKNVFTDVPVIYDHQLLQTIKNKNETLNLSVEQMEAITDKLYEERYYGRKSRKEHKRQVRENINLRKQREDSLICPCCEGNLVLRTGKYGSFYGCSNYPRCRYTRNPD